MPLRHALEVKHHSFASAAFVALAKQRGMAIVHEQGEGAPEFDQRTAKFSYARFMVTREQQTDGVPATVLDSLAAKARAWAKQGDVFGYFISGAKPRNPAAAQAVMRKLASPGRRR